MKRCLAYKVFLFWQKLGVAMFDNLVPRQPGTSKQATTLASLLASRNSPSPLTAYDDVSGAPLSHDFSSHANTKVSNQNITRNFWAKDLVDG